MTAVGSLLTGARRAYDARAWSEAHALLREADRHGVLTADDLQTLAVVAYLVGEDDESTGAWDRAHASYLVAGQVALAARCAFWAGHLLVLRGEGARGNGWTARADRLLDEHGVDGPERGLLRMWEARLVLGEDPQAALALLRRANELATETGDPDLRAFTWLVHAQTLVHIGEPVSGLRLLDEALLEVHSGRVTPVATGIIYCAAILTCQDAFDMARVTEWTATLHDWCAARPDLVPFRGQCLVHRSEVMQFHGHWSDAWDEIDRACRHLDLRRHDPVLGLARYQQGQLCRVQGRYDEAEECYAAASRSGYDPQPGLALLRLAQERPDVATPAIRRAMGEARDPVTRAKVLAAYVEIMTAVGDVEDARRAADELAGIAATSPAPMLRATAAQSTGLVRLSEGDPASALAATRDAAGTWQLLDAPYEQARARELIAAACRELGDLDTATLELAAALDTYETLGAAPDRARVDEQLSTSASTRPGGLTPRETEVIRLLASGATNRAIAGQLVISEKTVERHVSNIFLKLGVPNRGAAIAYAHEHGLA